MDLPRHQGRVAHVVGTDLGQFSARWQKHHMQMFPECLCKPGGPSVLTQRAMSLGDALTPAKDHDPQHQVGRRVAYQPQERAIGSQRSQREPLKHGLAQSLDPWREWEEPRDRRHPARHAVHGEEHPAEDEYDRLEQLLEYLQALEARRQPTRMREYPTLPTTSMSSGSRAAHRSGIVTDTTRLIKRSSRITVRTASTMDATTRPTVKQPRRERTQIQLFEGAALHLAEQPPEKSIRLHVEEDVPDEAQQDRCQAILLEGPSAHSEI